LPQGCGYRLGVRQVETLGVHCARVRGVESISGDRELLQFLSEDSNGGRLDANEIAEELLDCFVALADNLFPG
jgi:hypothetical protein